METVCPYENLQRERRGADVEIYQDMVSALGSVCEGAALNVTLERNAPLKLGAVWNWKHIFSFIAESHPKEKNEVLLSGQS